MRRIFTRFMVAAIMAMMLLAATAAPAFAYPSNDNDCNSNNDASDDDSGILTDTDVLGNIQVGGSQDQQGSCNDQEDNEGNDNGLVGVGVDLL